MLKPFNASTLNWIFFSSNLIFNWTNRFMCLSFFSIVFIMRGNNKIIHQNTLTLKCVILSKHLHWNHCFRFRFFLLSIMTASLYIMSLKRQTLKRCCTVALFVVVLYVSFTQRQIECAVFWGNFFRANFVLL